MIGQFVDIMIFSVNWYRMVIMTHQTLSLEKYWELHVTSHLDPNSDHPKGTYPKKQLLLLQIFLFYHANYHLVQLI